MIKTFSPKQWDYINTRKGVKFECLEGTTFSGKSQAQMFKFGLSVLESSYPYHIIACISGGKAESMIQNENGFLELFPFAKYYGKGDKDIRLSHIKFAGKIIYLCGYKNKDAFELIRGMNTIGMSMVDEINLCHDDFRRELLTRSNDYMMASTNPDDPRLPVFTELINHCRPFKKYASDVPKEIMVDLEKATPYKGYYYWHFSFKDNPAATPKIIEDKKAKTPPGSKQWKNLILGLRGKATGLVFSMFNEEKHTVKTSDIKRQMEEGEITPLLYTCGVDTAYSDKSEDATVFSFQMITTDRKVIILDEAYFNNRDLDNPLAPSDVVPNLVAFLKKNQREWGYCRDVWIDSADKATAMEVEKYQRFNDCPYIFNDAAKQTKIIDRIKMMQSWIYTGHYLVCDHCAEHLHELSTYSWDESKISTPEDRNDHTINASQYGWLPHKWEIGATKYEE